MAWIALKPFKSTDGTWRAFGDEAPEVAGWRPREQERWAARRIVKQVPDSEVVNDRWTGAGAPASPTQAPAPAPPSPPDPSPEVVAEPQRLSRDELEEMTREQLHEMADMLGLELGSKVRKAELIEAILSA